MCRPKSGGAVSQKLQMRPLCAPEGTISFVSRLSLLNMSGIDQLRQLGITDRSARFALLVSVMTPRGCNA